MHSKLKGYLDQLNSKAEWTSLRFVEDETRTLFARDEKLRPTFHSKTSGIMVEVLVDGQFSYAGTCDVSLEGVQAAYQKAMSMAEIAKNWQLIPFSQDQRPQAIGSYSSPSKISFDTMGIAELSSLLIDCTKTMKKSDSILSRHAYATHSITRTHFVSSNGSDFQQTISQNLLNLEVTAENNGQVQSRSSGSEVSQMGYEFFDRNLMMEQANNISEQVLELLQAENCPSDTREVILAPSQLYLQIHESIGHPLELDRILGDERNYAGWSFVNLEDFGKLQYGSSKLNVTFDPTIETELASYMFDDTGAKAEKQYLIKDGVLLRGLGSLESQLRSKVPGVACARATSWNRPPLDRMANLNIEPGESSLEDMIASVERGILMDTNKSWSIDDYRNKFQFGCEYGKLIEDGRLTKTVKNPNYRGQCVPFWKNLKMVGNHDTHEVWGSFFCGKAEPNQVIRVGHATPYCLFSDIEVFGGVQ